jgi:hypothetical protein
MRLIRLPQAALFIFVVPFCAMAQQQTPPSPADPQSVAEASRKAREAKKTPPKAGKSYDNDNIGNVRGEIYVVGPTPPEPPAAKDGAQPAKPDASAGAAKDAPAKEEKGEAYWRKRFGEAHQKLALAEKELDIMQRELNLLNVQFYSDPQKAMDEQLHRKEINDKQKNIDDKKKEVAQLKQAIDDLETDLKRAGGDPGWAR